MRYLNKAKHGWWLQPQLPESYWLDRIFSSSLSLFCLRNRFRRHEIRSKYACAYAMYVRLQPLENISSLSFSLRLSIVGNFTVVFVPLFEVNRDWLSAQGKSNACRRFFQDEIRADRRNCTQPARHHKTKRRRCTNETKVCCFLFLSSVHVGRGAALAECHFDLRKE